MLLCGSRLPFFDNSRFLSYASRSSMLLRKFSPSSFVKSTQWLIYIDRNPYDDLFTYPEILKLMHLLETRIMIHIPGNPFMIHPNNQNSLTDSFTETKIPHCTSFPYPDSLIMLRSHTPKSSQRLFIHIPQSSVRTWSIVTVLGHDKQSFRSLPFTRSIL